MLEVFKNNQFLIRVAKDEFNEPLFCLNDVCKSLELANTNHAKRSIEREWQGVTLNVTPFKTEGGIQNFTMISEPQLYFLIMRSDKPNAKAFRMWVNCEVLPTIRKQGHYSIKQNQLSFNKTIPQEMRKQLAENGYLLLDRNAFCGLAEGLGARVCDGLRQILGNYPSCLGQLATVTAYGALNYYETKIMQTLGTNITPWGVNCCVANIELRKADNCYSPIYNKWVIEDGKQDPRWELELNYIG